MKKIIVLITILIFNINLFSFSLNSLEFDEVIKIGEFKIKEYVLKNNSNEIKKYSISVDSKNVEIEPKAFILSPQKEQTFTIKILGNGNNYENVYHTTIIEKGLNKKKNNSSIYLNKVVKIKQKYFIK